MAYTKNHDPWASGNTLTTTVLDNFETIYTEASSYLTTHTHDSSYYTKSEMESTFWYSGNDGSGSGSDADLIYKSTGNLHASSFAGLGVPTGIVILWYGSVASIPTGWHLCDGTDGTIDLTDIFVVGAGSDYSVGDTGGSTTFAAAGSITVANHTLTTDEIPAHNHPFTDTYAYNPGSPPNNGSYFPASGALKNGSSSSSGNTSSTGSGTGHGHSTAEGTSFTGNAVACLPFAIALCYIQKI